MNVKVANILNDDWNEKSSTEQAKAKIKLPTIPKEHDVRFRNKFDRIRAFSCWLLQLEEYAQTYDHPLQARSKKFVLDTEKSQFLAALYRLLKKNMTFLHHFEKQEKGQVLDVFPTYLHAIEWAIDYKNDGTNKYEVKLRKAYVDAICEQCFDGKYVRNEKTGKREWLKNSVPLRITDVHKFASFIVPNNHNLSFNRTREALTIAGDKNTDRRERNKFRAIQNQIAGLSAKW